ncbi:hypothetical protein V2O64_24585 (plasmid) [Verrucomicrobiaceae bacterium 227]
MKNTGTYNHVLSGVATAYAGTQTGLVANILFPAFRSGVQAGEYPIFSAENMLNVTRLKQRAPGAPYPNIQLEVGKGKFATNDYGGVIPLDNRQKKIYRSNFDADQAATMTLTNTLLINKEWRAKEVLDASGVPTSTPATKWDAVGGNAKEDVKLARRAIRQNCGRKPNEIIIASDVFDFLEDSDALREQFKYTSNVMSLDTPTLGRTFVWNENNSSSGEFSAKSWTENNPGSMHHLLMHDVEEAIVAPACAYRFQNVLT